MADEPLRVGTAEARRRFREILDRVAGGETVEIARRDRTVAVVGPPPADPPDGESLRAELREWRRRWDVASWANEDPFADVRDTDPGRPAPW